MRAKEEQMAGRLLALEQQTASRQSQLTDELNAMQAELEKCYRQNHRRAFADVLSQLEQSRVRTSNASTDPAQSRSTGPVHHQMDHPEASELHHLQSVHLHQQVMDRILQTTDADYLEELEYERLERERQRLMEPHKWSRQNRRQHEFRSWLGRLGLSPRALPQQHPDQQGDSTSSDSTPLGDYQNIKSAAYTREVHHADEGWALAEQLRAVQSELAESRELVVDMQLVRIKEHDMVAEYRSLATDCRTHQYSCWLALQEAQRELIAKESRLAESEHSLEALRNQLGTASGSERIGR